MSSRNRVWSLWDMLNLKAAAFYEAVSNLRRLQARIEADSKKQGPLSDKDKAAVRKHVNPLRDALAMLETSGAFRITGWILNDLDNGKGSYASFVRRVHDLDKMLREELIDTNVFVLQRRDNDFFSPGGPLFGQSVEDKFGAARDDIEEAGKSVALERYTACVFHLMRAAELAVAVLGKKLKATVKSKHDETLPWGVLVANIETRIKALPKGAKQDAWWKIHALMHSMNRAYRTKTAHPAAKYNPEEALEAYETTRAFMREMAKLA